MPDLLFRVPLSITELLFKIPFGMSVTVSRSSIQEIPSSCLGKVSVQCRWRRLTTQKPYVGNVYC